MKTKKLATTHICKYDKTIDVMLGDIHEIRADVKSLLAFKYQIAGAAIIISSIISIILGLYI